MNIRKRKSFLIKDNFQIAFIAGFIAVLFIEVIFADFFIYRLSHNAIEEAAFRSHLSIDRSAQIVGPIIFKVNIHFILISFLFAILIALITYYRLHILFGRIAEGFDKLKNNNTSFRLKFRGIKATRELVKEFNQAASYLDKRRKNLEMILDSLLIDEDLDHIDKLHNELYAVIAEKK